MVEHVDERLDRFCADDLMGAIFDLIVDTENLVDQEVKHVLRLIDPTAQVVVLLGKKYSFARLEHSIERIYQTAEIMEGRGGRLGSDVSATHFKIY